MFLFMGYILSLLIWYSKDFYSLCVLLELLQKNTLRTIKNNPSQIYAETGDNLRWVLNSILLFLFNGYVNYPL